jgi:putative ABC transport system permease protein
MTKLLFIKILRDLRATWGRTVSMIFAISLSLVAFSAMLYAFSIVDSQQSINYANANPASARIVLDPAALPDQVEAIRALAKTEPKVIDETMRSIFSAPIQGEDQSLLLFAIAPDDPMRISRFTVEQGSWPPPADGILVDRSTLRSLNAKVGDDITVTGSDGTLVQLTITGVVHDQTLAPGRFGYISTDTLPLLGRPTVLNQLFITVADQAGQTEPSRDRDAIVSTAVDLVNRIQGESGAAIEEVAVPEPYQHPHQNISDALILGLLTFSALSLLLSSILIATMFNGLLTQQIPQIGILKAIGVRSNRILQLYLIMILLISITATALAFFPGIVLGRALAQMVLSGALNMDVTSLSLPWWTYASVIALGIVLPLLMALVPIMQASRRTVREALDEHGVDHHGVNGTGLNALLGKFHRLNRTLLLAFRNIFRRRARFLLSVVLLATAGTIFMSGLNTRGGLQAIPDTAADTHLWDVEVSISESASAPELANILSQVPGAARVETWTSVVTGIQYAGQTNITRAYPDQGHGTVGVTAIPQDSTMFNPPPVLEGRWLHPDDIDAIVLPQTAQKTLPGVRVGDGVQLSIEGQSTDWRVVGIVKELSAGTCPCVSEAGFGEATGRKDQANLVRIVTDPNDPQTRIDVGESAIQALAGVSIEARSRVFDPRAGVEGHSGLLIVFIFLIASVIGVVGLVGLGSMMSTSVIERTREFGVMSAIGAPPSTIRRLVVLEGVFIALASSVVAVILALILTAAINAGVGNLFFNAPIPFLVSVSGVIVWIAAVSLGAVLATLAPAYRASRLTVREAFTYL